MRAGFAFSNETIEFDGGFISVRPLAVSEMISLFEEVSSDLAALFDHHVSAEPASLLQDEKILRSYMWALLRRAPLVIARAIALAADEPEKLDLCLTLPIDVTVVAVSEILRLSLATDEQLSAVLNGIGNAASSKSRFIAGQRH